MEEKIYKVTLASRVDPDLRDEILDEAAEKNMTPSAYIEVLLLNRQSPVDRDDLEDHLTEMVEERDDYAQKAQEAQQALVEAQEQNTELKQQLKELSLKSIDLTEEQREEAEIYISTLQDEYDDMNRGEIIMGALYSAAYNAVSSPLFAKCPSDYFKKSKEERLQKFQNQ